MDTTDDFQMDQCSFEAIKISMNQTDDGLVLKMAVHPDDAPEKLMESFNGSRYMVAMVKINDDETPELDFLDNEIKRLKSSCGALCRNRKFQEYILKDGFAPSLLEINLNEENTVCILKKKLNIKSRAEFSTNEQARNQFIQIREDFQAWLKYRSLFE